MNLQTLISVQSELTRFQQKLDYAINRSSENKGVLHKGQMINAGIIDGTKESSALKRAAMDLKNELHKITAK